MIGEPVRADERSAEQLRPVRITPDFVPTAEGSVLIEVGQTRVICTATVEDGVPAFRKGSGKGWVTAEYGMLPRACERMVAAGILKHVPIEDSVAAVSVGLANGDPVLDLCYEEDATAEVDMNVVMTGSGKFVELQATAEGRAFESGELAILLKLAKDGIEELTRHQLALLGTKFKK